MSLSRNSRHSDSRIAVTFPSMMLLALVALSGCGDPDAGGGTDATVFEGARLIVGDGSEAIEDAVFIVENDRFTQVGSKADVEIPSGATRVDLGGKTVMPALVNAHVHLAPEREARTDQVQHMAYYGAGAVLSLGLDTGDVPFEMRNELVRDGARSQSAGRGITAPEPGRSEVPHWVTSEEEARSAVRELAAQQVDFVKIWVDDRGGQYERLSPAFYGAVIDEAHANGLRVTAHVFRLEDAKGLLRAGIDAFAHGIRDMDIDDEVLALWKERPHVVLVPNLPGPGVAQESFGIQARNLNRLNSEGITISFGTDGSSPWAVHQEMEDMVRAGMSPAEVITAATGTSAELLEIGDIGTIAAGKSADFIVLDTNPLDDITNTRQIDTVYLRGSAIDREALGARFRGASQ